MWSIYQNLKECKDRICPASKDTYKSFLKCDFDNIKAVIVLMEPYSWIKKGIIVADGLPMSSSNTNILQPSLEQFYQGMSNELEEEVVREPNLEYLLEQGVFMINAALTVRENRVGSHSELWGPFMKDLFENVLSLRTGMPYWLLGKEAQKVEKYISPLGNYIIKGEHPAAASHRNTTWESKGTFKMINKIIREQNGPEYEIIWNSANLAPF